MQVLVQRRHHVRLLTYAQVSKEACSYGKRGLFIWRKRPIHMAKEAYQHVMQYVPSPKVYQVCF